MAWRRINRAQLRGLAAQEFAEDPVTCFRASGECVFDLEAIEQALPDVSEPLETRDNGRLATWFPPQPGSSTSWEWIRRAGGRKAIMRARR